MVSTFKQSDYTSQNGSEYPLAIDASISVMARIARVFAPHEQDVPNMSVVVDPGVIFTAGSLNEVAAQSTVTIAAPLANPRIDRIVVDASTGAVEVLPGAENSSPSPPNIPGNKLPVARVQLTTTTTEITNADIIDERVALGAAGGSSQRNFRPFTATGNHVLILPPSVNSFLAELVGGGGGGDQNGQGGGAAGGYALFENLPFGAEVQITIGAGGPGASTNAGSGSATIITVPDVAGLQATAGGGAGRSGGNPSPAPGGVWSTSGITHQAGWNGGGRNAGWQPSLGSGLGTGGGSFGNGGRGGAFIYY